MLCVFFKKRPTLGLYSKTFRKDSEKMALSDAPIHTNGLFREAVGTFSEHFLEAQKQSKAMSHFMSKQSTGPRMPPACSRSSFLQRARQRSAGHTSASAAAWSAHYKYPKRWGPCPLTAAVPPPLPRPLPLINAKTNKTIQYQNKFPPLHLRLSHKMNSSPPQGSKLQYVTQALMLAHGSPPQSGEQLYMKHALTYIHAVTSRRATNGCTSSELTHTHTAPRPKAATWFIWHR